MTRQLIISNGATAVSTRGPATTVAVTATAQSANRSRVPHELKNEPPKFSRRTIFMSSSRFLNRSLPSLSKTKISFTAFCFEPQTRPCPPSLPILNIWELRSASLPYSTVGDRTWIPISIVSSRAAESHPMVLGGSPAALAYSCPCGCSPASSAACS